ncbi:hypothetical protein CSOJ01_15501 [Colletotrichum sojae]|uniref:Uncharacterized protein n=1 Tax=Colletotrichum sojae TaxID=2175907 RepID=A0A8H6MHP6_9PEZI|nr:hypothetical protein CSOJ01_15501 [Colletotrichum sojae]
MLNVSRPSLVRHHLVVTARQPSWFPSVTSLRVGQPLGLAAELERFDEAEADAEAATSQLAARVAGERDELCPHLNVVVGVAGICVASVNSAAQGTTPGIVPAPRSGRGVGWLQYAGVRPAARWLLPGATLVIGSTKFRGLPSGARPSVAGATL